MALQRCGGCTRLAVHVHVSQRGRYSRRVDATRAPAKCTACQRAGSKRAPPWADAWPRETAKHLKDNAVGWWELPRDISVTFDEECLGARQPSLVDPLPEPLCCPSTDEILDEQLRKHPAARCRQCGAAEHVDLLHRVPISDFWSGRRPNAHHWWARVGVPNVYSVACCTGVDPLKGLVTVVCHKCVHQPSRSVPQPPPFTMVGDLPATYPDLWPVCPARVADHTLKMSEWKYKANGDMVCRPRVTALSGGYNGVGHLLVGTHNVGVHIPGVMPTDSRVDWSRFIYDNRTDLKAFLESRAGACGFPEQSSTVLDANARGAEFSATAPPCATLGNAESVQEQEKIYDATPGKRAKRGGSRSPYESYVYLPNFNNSCAIDSVLHFLARVPSSTMSGYGGPTCVARAVRDAITGQTSNNRHAIAARTKARTALCGGMAENQWMDVMHVLERACEAVQIDKVGMILQRGCPGCNSWTTVQRLDPADGVLRDVLMQRSMQIPHDVLAETVVTTTTTAACMACGTAHVERVHYELEGAAVFISSAANTTFPAHMAGSTMTAAIYERPGHYVAGSLLSDNTAVILDDTIPKPIDNPAGLQTAPPGYRIVAAVYVDDAHLHAVRFPRLKTGAAAPAAAAAGSGAVPPAGSGAVSPAAAGSGAVPPPESSATGSQSRVPGSGTHPPESCTREEDAEDSDADSAASHVSVVLETADVAVQRPPTHLGLLVGIVNTARAPVSCGACGKAVRFCIGERTACSVQSCRCRKQIMCGFCPTGYCEKHLADWSPTLALKPLPARVQRDDSSDSSRDSDSPDEAPVPTEETQAFGLIPFSVLICATSQLLLTRASSSVRIRSLVAGLESASSVPTHMRSYYLSTLFPYHFPLLKAGVPIGDIPTPLRKQSSAQALGLQSVEDIFCAWMRSPQLSIGYDQLARSAMLDILLNRKLAYSHSDDLLRGGIEGARIGGQRRMNFDEEDASMNAKILRSTMRELGDATWFLTITFNFNATPGLKDWTDAVKLNGVHPQCYQHHMMRQMSYSWRRIQAWLKGPAQPMGPITHIWSRWEMQPDCGAFPHLHILMWSPIPISQAMRMATCDCYQYSDPERQKVFRRQRHDC